MSTLRLETVDVFTRTLTFSVDFQEFAFSLVLSQFLSSFLLFFQGIHAADIFYLDRNIFSDFGLE